MIRTLIYIQCEDCTVTFPDLGDVIEDSAFTCSSVSEARGGGREIGWVSFYSTKRERIVDYCPHCVRRMGGDVRRVVE